MYNVLLAYMISMCFLEAYKDPSIQVGAFLKPLNGNYRVGSSEYFIIEACEYCESYLNFKQKSYSNSGDEYLHYYIDESYAFKCPCCGKENLINKNDIPERMRKLLKTTESSKKRLSDYKKTLSKK